MIVGASFLIGNFAKACDGGTFLGFPTWYKYLDGKTDSITKTCAPVLGSINDIWLIIAAVIEILLRVAGMAAVAFIIFGGFQYLTSQGEPDATNKARLTIINALVGLAISILAAVLVNFVAGSIN